MLNCTFRPLQRWPRPPAKARRSSPFRASYPATLSLLERELGHLRARQVVIQLDLSERDIRNDGWPRANARPGMPGVIVAFQSAKGPLQFCCDAFLDWESNLRGVALTLERLRMIDLYGVTSHGEQYTGWSALPPAPTDDVEGAARFIANECGCSVTRWEQVLGDPGVLKEAYDGAKRRLHPDVEGGSHEAFVRLQQARETVEGSR